MIYYSSISLFLFIENKWLQYSQKPFVVILNASGKRCSVEEITIQLKKLKKLIVQAFFPTKVYLLLPS